MIILMDLLLGTMSAWLLLSGVGFILLFLWLLALGVPREPR